MYFKEIIAENCGTITVSVYKDQEGSTLFLVNPDSEDISSVADIIEDTLKLY